MTDTEDKDVLAAEYVLGTLGPTERRQAQTLISLDPDFAATVRKWEGRLGELNVLVASVEPPPELSDKIKETIAEIGVLRAGAGDHAEDIRVQRPARGQPLAERGAEISVPGARARLEFRLESLAERVHQVRFASRRLEAEEQ